LKPNGKNHLDDLTLIGIYLFVIF